jgi:hypothetical protein
MEKAKINPIEIDIVGNRIRRITPLAFNPTESINKQGAKMNWIGKLLKAILPYIPFKIIFGILLDYLQGIFEKTDNDWDDTALLSLWVVLNTLNLADPPPQSLIDKCKRAN